MGQRNMICSNQMMDIEMNQRSRGYLRPEPCIFLGGLPNLPQPDIQTIITTTGNTTNLSSHNRPECYDGAMFYGVPQYQGVQHHSHHHPPNPDLGVASGPNFYVPYMAQPSGIPQNHRSCDQLSSSSSYGVIGVPADHHIDNVRGAYKRKNADCNLGNFQYCNAFLSSGTSVSPVNARHPDGIALVDAASFTLPQYGGNGSPSVREVEAHRSTRNRLGASGLTPLLAQNQNHLMHRNYVGQRFHPAGSIWLDQQFSNNSNDAAASAWTQSLSLPFIHGNNVMGGSLETRGTGPQRYHESTSNRSNPSFLRPSAVNIQRHGYGYFSHPTQAVRGHNINIHPQVPAASYSVPTSYASQAQSTVNTSQDASDTGFRHVGSVQQSGLRIYRSHHEGVLSDTPQSHLYFPSMRIMPTNGVALLDLPEYYEVENYDDHREMRLDIEDMSYEELLALGEQIGNVNTGLSEEAIRSQLKTRIHVSSSVLINLEEPASLDQEQDYCIICQEEYKSEEKIGTLYCGHEYHADCLKKWLLVKNVCPVCKSEALTVERKDA
ncbi:hypothetical protein K2173_016508 [Erythroxylum novogranatense]|uniref:RING-type E3 ubiquitin transferase n=1 Tax=Erythroxylum novogranatense TaxID=1862640 RepID=A0AAV8SSR8_9ROSI|nr:hypothetical protein K2173_016508 [Erythroxylum novogranatense]